MTAQSAKSASIGAGGFAREKDDFYPTPDWCVEALLWAVDFPGVTWEPACGDGAILRVFERAGLPVFGSDLIDRGCGVVGVDFLGIAPLRAVRPPDAEHPRNIVTNPPFKHASDFAERALDIATGKVAMLVRFNWIAAKSRRKLLTDPRCERVLILGRAKMLPPGVEDKGHSPMVDFCWVVWDQEKTDGPVRLEYAKGGA